VTLASFATAGCGDRQIDVKKASQNIDHAVATEFGARVRSVSCPAKVPVKAKTSFRCVVTGTDGSTGDAVVTQSDGKGNMTVRVPFLHPRQAEQAIQSELSKGTPGTTVSCQEIIVVRKGAPFACKATLAGVSTPVSATQTNADGKFTYRVG
jgi:hypothetical protein